MIDETDIKSGENGPRRDALPAASSGLCAGQSTGWRQTCRSWWRGSRLENSSSPKPSGWKRRWEPWKDRLFNADLAAVHFIGRSARTAAGRHFAIIVSKLGDGWLYPLLGLFVFEFLGDRERRVILLAGVNVGLLHCLYPRIKRFVGRPRPFNSDPTLSPLFRAIDEFSFPSGHAMTLSGALVPIVLACPGCSLSAAALMLTMAWARIATAHHYPSDIFGGILLSLALAYPLSAWALAE